MQHSYRTLSELIIIKKINLNKIISIQCLFLQAIKVLLRGTEVFRPKIIFEDQTKDY